MKGLGIDPLPTARPVSMSVPGHLWAAPFLGGSQRTSSELAMRVKIESRFCSVTIDRSIAKSSDSCAKKVGNRGGEDVVWKSRYSSPHHSETFALYSSHVNIPKIWLSNFMASLYEGLSVNYSVFKANQSVSEEYQTPAAWACMHLYGNPHLAIKRK